MRHTVIGIFDSYDQAEVARSALLASGFISADIELQAAPKGSPASPADPSLMSTGVEPSDTSMLGNIERFFSMLFGGRERPPEVEHYSEAVRRGAILVSVDTATEDFADLARETLAQQGAIDIDERAASWGTLGHGDATRTDRDHSLLDEIGLGSGSAVPGREPVNPANDPLAPTRASVTGAGLGNTGVNRARAYPRTDLGDPAVDPLADPLVPTDALDPISPVGRDTFAGGADSTYRATGGDPMTSSTTGSNARRETFTRYTGTADSLTGARSQTAKNPVDVNDMYPVNTNTDAYRTTSAATDAADRATLSQGWQPVSSRDPLDETEASTRTDESVARSLSQSPTRGTGMTGAGSGIPDEYMEYEDDFRADYDSKYAATGGRFEDYEHAYRYGAAAGTDERYRSRQWDDSMENDLRADWSSRNTTGEDTWERFKLAVRHGWDRVTGHHHL
jgi:hypothetical protein